MSSCIPREGGGGEERRTNPRLFSSLWWGLGGRGGGRVCLYTRQWMGGWVGGWVSGKRYVPVHVFSLLGCEALEEEEDVCLQLGTEGVEFFLVVHLDDHPTSSSSSSSISSSSICHRDLLAGVQPGFWWDDWLVPLLV